MGLVLRLTLGLVLRLLRWVVLAAVAILIVALAFAQVVPLPASPDLEPSTLAAPGTRFLSVPVAAADGSGAPGSQGTLRTAVRELGPADGPAVVLVHGFGGSTFSWRATLPALAERGCRAVALDLADFGLSEKRFGIDTSHAAQARLVLAVMDELGIDRAVLVGHSMGGNVVAHVAAIAPARVRGLVLVDAAVVAPDGPGGGGALGLSGALLGPVLEIGPVRQLARQVLRRTLDEARLRAILTSAYADPATVTDAVFSGYAAQLRTPDWDLALLQIVRDGGRHALPIPLAGLRAPTLVVWGERDPWIPLARGVALTAAVPGASLRTIPGAGHLPMEEAPEAFVAVLASFLDGLPAG